MGSNLYQETPASSAATTGTPAKRGLHHARIGVRVCAVGEGTCRGEHTYSAWMNAGLLTVRTKKNGGAPEDTMAGFSHLSSGASAETRFWNRCISTEMIPPIQRVCFFGRHLCLPYGDKSRDPPEPPPPSEN